MLLDTISCGNMAQVQVECYLTSTETVQAIMDGKPQPEGHLDFHTSPGLCSLMLPAVHRDRSPGEIKRREMELDPQISPEEIISREVDLG